MNPAAHEQPAGTHRSSAAGAPVERPVAASVREAFEWQARELEEQLQGEIGVALRLLSTGESLAIRGDERFPMASTFKIAIAGAALTQVDQGALTLEQMLAITPQHVADTGPIAVALTQAGISLSLANLLETMLRESNNTATDRVLAAVGGPAAVTTWLRALGIHEMRVDRTVTQILNQYFEFPAGTAAHAEYLRRYPTDSARAEIDGKPNAAFDADPADTTTPRAMVDLLTSLFAGNVLSMSSQRFLRDVMTACITGADRLKGLLPAGTAVAHKTGTIGGTINDAGIISLPGGRGELAIAVLTRRSPIVPWSRRERCLAEVARAAYDYFAFR